MRQTYQFKESKLDEFHEQIIFFFESIYFQSQYGSTNWEDAFIHSKLKPLYTSCPKLRLHFHTLHTSYSLVGKNEKLLVYESAKNSFYIGGICNATVPMAHKDDFTPALGNAMHNLFKYIYYQLPKTKAFIDIYGELINHYDNLKKLNRKIKMCPFCGLHPIKPLKSSTRQTYDHYFPLSKYPFLALNTKNLVPTCKDCNEDHKEDKDVLFRDDKRSIRRKLIYPYGCYQYTPSVSIRAYSFDSTTLEIKVCALVVSNEEGVLASEMQSWKEIYEVDNRYKNTVVNDSKEWYEEYLDYIIQRKLNGTYVSQSLAYADYINVLRTSESTTNSFLKRPFFIEMERLTTVFS